MLENDNFWKEKKYQLICISIKNDQSLIIAFAWILNGIIIINFIRKIMIYIYRYISVRNVTDNDFKKLKY